MSKQERVELAEWMGWTECFEVPEDEVVMTPTKRYSLMGTAPGETDPVYSFLPDPRNDASDCEALINHLRKMGYGWTIEPWPDDIQVSLYANAAGDIADAEYIDTWKGADWKTGVCELALKVRQESGTNENAPPER